MKSLEIVNILLEDVKIKNKYVFERVYNAPIATSDLETIKQDLEVLEILIDYIDIDNEGGIIFSFLDDLEYNPRKYGVVYNYISCHKVGNSNE